MLNELAEERKKRLLASQSSISVEEGERENGDTNKSMLMNRSLLGSSQMSESKLIKN
jgi:hypothetical protein